MNQTPGTLRRQSAPARRLAVNHSPLLQVIETVAEGATTLAALETRLPDLSRSKIHRALAEAEAADWLVRERGEGWTVGPKVQRLWLLAVEAKRAEAEKIIEELRKLIYPQIVQISGGENVPEKTGTENNPPAAAGGGVAPTQDPA
jgi:hypothetical protein